MSLFKSIGKAVKKVVKKVGKVVKPLAPIAATFVGGPLGGLATLAASSLTAPRPMTSAASMLTVPGMTNSILGGLGYAEMGTRTLPGAGDVYAAGPSIKMPVPRRPVPATARERRIEQIPRTIGPSPGVGGTVVPGTGARNKLTPWGWLPKVGKRAAEFAGWVAIGTYWYDQISQSIVGVRPSRRMNPLNAHALRRAIRRVKGAKKICNEVERITGSSRRRSSGRGGRARAEAACR